MPKSFLPTTVSSRIGKLLRPCAEHETGDEQTRTSLENESAQNPGSETQDKHNKDGKAAQNRRRIRAHCANKDTTRHIRIFRLKDQRAPPTERLTDGPKPQHLHVDAQPHGAYQEAEQKTM